MGRQPAVLVAEQREQSVAAGAADTQPVVVQSLDGTALGAGPERVGVFAVAGGAVRAVGQAGRDAPDSVAAGAAFPTSSAARAQGLPVGGS